MHLIVNADDLGYSPGVNEAILELHWAGRLSSASLLVNLSHSAAAIGAVRGTGLAVGVHLNLTRGRPCLPVEAVPSLVTEDGEFHHSPAFFARAAAGLIRRGEVEAECRAQIDHALAGLGAVAHLDSHSHWHLIPSLRPALWRLAHEYGVKRVRTAVPRRTLYPNTLWLAAVTGEAGTALTPARPDYLLSLHHWLDAEARPAALMMGRRVRGLLGREGVTAELVAHPGRAADPDFPTDTLPADRREREREFLLGAEFEGWLAALGAELSLPDVPPNA
jgi:predicted glycoside hydrolase/deacetylase ChbG (UPF0249 family)